MNDEILLTKLESQRKKANRGLFIGLLVSLISLFLIPLIAQYAAIILVPSLVITLFVYSNRVKQYQKDYKDDFMPILIAKSGLDLKYKPKEAIPLFSILNSKLMKKPDRYYLEDLLYGEIDGVKFSSCDVRLEERHTTVDSKGHTHTTYQPYFVGRWLIYEFNKNFNGIVQVREDGMFQGALWGLNLNKIALEDIEFNKKFKTYASHQHDAFYILTPSLMESIKKLEQRNKGKIYFSFINNELHIAIYNSKNYFEAPLLRAINDEYINEQLADILTTKEIVNELKLSRTIFK